MNQPKSVAFSCFLYRVVLSLGPSTFCMELQSLLLSDFQHLCLEAHARAGAGGVFALLPIHMRHTFCDIGGEHFDLIKSRIVKILQEIHEANLHTNIVYATLSDVIRILGDVDKNRKMQREKMKMLKGEYSEHAY